MEYCVQTTELNQRLVPERFPLVDGYVDILDAPGLGIEMDEAALKEFTVDEVSAPAAPPAPNRAKRIEESSRVATIEFDRVSKRFSEAVLAVDDLSLRSRTASS